MTGWHPERAIATIGIVATTTTTTTTLGIITIVWIPTAIVADNDDVRLTTAKDATARTTHQTQNRQTKQTSAHYQHLHQELTY